MSGLLIQDALDQLNQMVSADGAVIRLVESDQTSVHLELDLRSSSCPECVVPASLLIQILRSAISETFPDVRDVRLDDPREESAVTG